MFFTNDVYQGAQKRVYPYALQDNLTDSLQNKQYAAAHLENEYIKLTVLPEIGGRLFAATDKTNDYDFVYHPEVIKPALFGMLGAWVCGGIEWSVFHHHRNTSFMPVSCRLADNSDGSKTIWLTEIERRHRMKWLVGITLYPGKSYIETSVKLFNRTPYPHAILYWANMAVPVNENYQMIFPPSVRIVTDHEKPRFRPWPISSDWGRIDNDKGADISWWRNVDRSASFFAWDLQEDFTAGYDHGREAGVVHTGDHHVLCGAKFFTWGNGRFGRRMTSKLSDGGNGYAELMVGAWSDNQPDYSWIKPYEVKTLKHYWYPVRQIGGIKNAKVNGAVNLELRPDDTATLGFHTTSKHHGATVTLTARDEKVFEENIEIGPDCPFCKVIPLPAGISATELQATLVSGNSEELVSYQPTVPDPVKTLPTPVKAPPKPEAIKTVEELYFTGLRVEQMYKPNDDPALYYEEGLRRDPGDSCCNTRLGIRANKQGLYEKAERYLRQAIERISAEYTQPENTEAYYQLGLSLRAQDKIEEAYDCFYRASWDHAFHSAALYQLAELSCMRGAYARALEQIDASLSTNTVNTKARNVKTLILRKLGRYQEACEAATQVLAEDPLDFFAGNELYLARLAMNDRTASSCLLDELKTWMRDEVQSYMELATDYMACGQWNEAVDVLERPVEAKVPFAATYPLVHYYLGYLYERKGDAETALSCYNRASGMPTDYCFPYRVETARVLNCAIQANGDDARAYYYLGNLRFENEPDKGIACWEKAIGFDDTPSLAQENLRQADKMKTQSRHPRSRPSP